MTGAITRSRLAALSPADAAALWLVQRDQGLPVEAGLFEDWLEQSDANFDAWQAVERVWGIFEDADLADDPELAALRSAALADRAAPRWYDVREHWRPAAAAAALVAVVAGGLELGRRPTTGPDQIASSAGSAAAEQVFAASAVGSREVALADGTKMVLSPATQARVVLTADRRRVTLDRGALALAVKHDASRPFEVAALNRKIIDIGTHFEVALESGGMRVALFEGSVRVEGGGTLTVLRPGEQLVARRGQRDVVTRIATTSSHQSELLQFDNVTLATAADTVNRGSTVKLLIPDPRVGKLRVSGRFRAGEPERFARTASELLSLRMVRVGPTRIELRRGR